MVFRPPIQWYPGHIARAERQLKEQLKHVDVVLEVIDARLPLASHHPQVPTWIGAKPRLLVVNRMDMIPPASQRAWEEWFQAQGETPYFTDAKQGRGIPVLKQAAQRAGETMNQRRRDRGLRPRPVRAVVMGFPNVGKSALINRLVGRRAVRSARRAGVTRQLQWVRIADSIEMLDAPGIIPVRLDDQAAAIKLAICEDIGEAAYDNQRVAAVLVDLLQDQATSAVLQQRYALEPGTLTGEDFIQTLALRDYHGDKERVACLLLNDFRKGNLGAIALEYPPSRLGPAEPES